MFKIPGRSVNSDVFNVFNLDMCHSKSSFILCNKNSAPVYKKKKKSWNFSTKITRHSHKFYLLRFVTALRKMKSLILFPSFYLIDFCVYSRIKRNIEKILIREHKLEFIISEFLKALSILFFIVHCRVYIFMECPIWESNSVAITWKITMIKLSALKSNFKKP